MFLLEDSVFPLFSAKFSSDIWRIISSSFTMILEYLKKYKVSPPPYLPFCLSSLSTLVFALRFNFLFLAFSTCYPCSFWKCSFHPFIEIKKSWNYSLFSGYCLFVASRQNFSDTYFSSSHLSFSVMFHCLSLRRSLSNHYSSLHGAISVNFVKNTVIGKGQPFQLKYVASEYLLYKFCKYLWMNEC